MRFRSKDDDVAKALERTEARKQRWQAADETGIWSFLDINAQAIPGHACLRCGVPVLDKDVHLAWHERIGDPWP